MDTTQFAAAQQASADTFFTLSGQALDSVEQFAALQLQTVKSTLAESAESIQAVLSAKTPDEVLKLQAAALQAAPQKVLAYGRQVAELSAAVSSAPRAAFEAKMAEAQAKFVEAVESSLKNAPGSEHAVAMVKSAVDAGNKAFEGFQQAGKQVGDALSANIDTLADTAVKAAPKRARAKAEA